MWTKVLALQKCMVYIGLFHPCEHRANISDKDQGIELAFSIALADPNFLTTQRLSAFAQCPQLPEASRRSNQPTNQPAPWYKYFGLRKDHLKPMLIILVKTRSWAMLRLI